MIDSTTIDSISVDVLELLTQQFKALGDPTRLRVVALLAAGERCVCELQNAIETPGNLLSHHLKVLREAGLIEGKRRGRWIDYRLNENALARLRRALPPAAEALGLNIPAVIGGRCDEAEETA